MGLAAAAAAVCCWMVVVPDGVVRVSTSEGAALDGSVLEEAGADADAEVVEVEVEVEGADACALGALS